MISTLHIKKIDIYNSVPEYVRKYISPLFPEREVSFELSGVFSEFANLIRSTLLDEIEGLALNFDKQDIITDELHIIP